MSNKSVRAPLYEALVRHSLLHAAPFHVPGHKQRSGWNDEDANERYAGILQLDLTELSDTDDLHHPTDVIAEAEKLAASCFGSEETRFLVGGSTAGNLAMILGVCVPGDTLLVQRNVHKSVIHGLMLSGARCVFLPPVIDAGSGLALAPSLETVSLALRRHPEAKGLLLSNPNYYGMSADLGGIVEASHLAGIPVLVDEAHGPHFGRHPDCPPSALSAGADAVVQSAHKMLSAMTMGAYLHLQGDRLPREAVRQALRMVQSSSPSYPILASLDLARQQLQSRGAEAFEKAVGTAARIRSEIGYEGPYGLLDVRSPARLDPLKLTLYDETGTLDGFRLRDELEARGCIAEMADARYVVLALGIGTKREDGEALLSALRDIAVRFGLNDKAPHCEEGVIRGPADPPPPLWPLEPSDPVILSRLASETEALPLEEAVGEVCGEWVIPYPPGIPVLYPGERISAAIAERLTEWRREGARIQGAADERLRTVRVVRRT